MVVGTFQQHRHQVEQYEGPVLISEREGLMRHWLGAVSEIISAAFGFAKIRLYDVLIQRQTITFPPSHGP